ncbi:MAG: hypothetical protein JWO38_3200 [Gemmataceae bacterium]|nr:hypothetical protein [Gemmataceae bacterium]
MTATLLPLDKIDPVTAWQPWRPSPADPWGRKWAGHLYRRAAFGPAREDLTEAEQLGPAGILDLLLGGRPGADETLRTIVDIGQVAAAREDGEDQMRSWWVYGMLQGGHPLREKLVLFWHNHFATSIAKVHRPGLMFRQNCVLRDHALGRFGPLLQAISRDGAMLLWLDSNSNVKGKPNENYARELMELFSLGVGNYTEKDVREAARAFTGWHTDGEGFRFNPGLHDGGPKTVLGKTGSWDGGDVVRVILEQPATARFLVRKLYTFFVSETPPPDALLEPLCESFRKTDYDVAGLVRTMLASRHFYSDHAFRRRIKSPVEYVLGAVRAVYRRYAETDPEYRPLPQQVLVPRVTAMGQSLFAPPNVKGWPGGRAWLNTSTMLERANFAAALATGTLWTVPPSATDTAADAAPPRALDPARLPAEERATRPEDIADALLDLYVPGGVRPDARAKLVAFLAAGNPAGAALDGRVREAVHAVLAMPEYQLA